MGLEKKLNVLSLFDGMSGTQMALKNLGIKVDKYYASEIDKYAIQITRKNFPDTIHLGDVKDIKGEDFIRDIDLVVAGSPCQGFSFAGKQLAFDDERSALFFEFIRILREVKPKYFLLENVRMKKEFQDVISEQISSVYPEYTSGGLFSIEPILINSALVSAQNRNRLYWTNIPGVEQPEDLGIVLRDVLDYEPEEFTKMSDNFLKRNGERNCMIDDTKEKAHSFSAMDYVKNGRQGNYLACDDKGKPIYNTPKQFVSEEAIEKYVQDKNAEVNDTYNKRTVKGDKSTTIRPNNNTANIWVNEKAIRENKPTYNTPKQVGTAADLKGYDIIKRVYSEDGKSPTLTTMGGGHREPKVAVKGGAIRGRYNDEGKTNQHLEIRKDAKSNAITTVQKDSVAVSKIRNKSKTVRSGGRLSYDRHEWDSVDELHWRKLTPLECERLQTFPDNYTEGVSNTQRYKMLGNGFTVRVIEHILKNMEI
jgi:DNA (cytosine-5)-methyltransferase 3A